MLKKKSALPRWKQTLLSRDPVQILGNSHNGSFPASPLRLSVPSPFPAVGLCEQPGEWYGGYGVMYQTPPRPPEARR